MWSAIKVALLIGLGTYTVILSATGPYYGVIKCTDKECVRLDTEPKFYYHYKCQRVADAMKGWKSWDGKDWRYKCVKMAKVFS